MTIVAKTMARAHRLTYGLTSVVLALALWGCGDEREVTEEVDEPDTQAVVEAPQCDPGAVCLAVEDGVVFPHGEVIASASGYNVDLMTFKNGADFDVRTGVEPGTTSRRPMLVFRETNGKLIEFNDIDEVPVMYPTAKDNQNGGSIFKIRAGTAFVIRNNLSDGYTLVWVEGFGTGSRGPHVILRYRDVSDGAPASP